MAKQKIILESNLKHYDDKIKEYIGNQHKTFSSIKIDSTTISADSKEDTLTLEGSNVTLTPDADNDKVTIGITKDNVATALGYTPVNTLATISANGLMSSNDKIKLDNTNIAYGKCSTVAATAAKIITISGNIKWTLKAGSIIVVKFTETNTAQNPTFNVNNTGAKKVWYNTGLITTSNLGYAGYADRPMEFVFDGIQFVFMGWSIDTDTNTKNTTGTTNKVDTKLFLAGATSQAANPQTYSNANVYIGTDNCLYSNGKKVVHEVTITTDTDFNTFTETGIYHIAFTGGSNRPSGNHGTLYVDTEVGTDYQLFIPDSVDTVMYKRSYDNTNKVWKAWTTQKLTDTTNASTLSGKKLLAANATDTWDAIPYIDDKGVMEVGKYIDFHTTDGNTADKDVRLTASTDGLHISGETTLALKQNLHIIDDGGQSKTVIKVYNPTPDAPVSSGSEVIFGGGGNVFVGAGESYTTLRDALSNADTIKDEDVYNSTSERLYISADTSIHLYTNCNSVANRKLVNIADGVVYPGLTNSQNLGGAAKAWNTIYNKDMWFYNGGVWHGYLGSHSLGNYDTAGETRLILGNNASLGSDNNSRGLLFLYGTNKGYTLFNPKNNTDSNVTLNLPDHTGTLALVTTKENPNTTTMNINLAAPRNYIAFFYSNNNMCAYAVVGYSTNGYKLIDSSVKGGGNVTVSGNTLTAVLNSATTITGRCIEI